MSFLKSSPVPISALDFLNEEMFRRLKGETREKSEL